MTENVCRRRYLKLAGVAATTTALAGCGGGGDGDDGDGADGSDGGGSDGGGGDDGSDGNGGSDGSGSDGTGGSGKRVETDTVEMTDELTFEPADIQVESGTEVTWETVGSVGHTVTAYEDEIPDGAAYFASGGFESQQAAEDGYSDGEGNIPEGESYSHTFETTGTYEYYCIPHEMNGMVGTVEVV